MNAIIKPVIIPDEIEGSMTLKKDFVGVQPRSKAASDRCESS